MEVLYCLDAEPHVLGFFDPTVAPALLYYAYIPIVILALLIGWFVFYKRSGFKIPNVLLLLISVVFSLHLFNEILHWITVPAALVQFEWQMVAIYLTTLSLLTVYFVFTLINKHDLTFGHKITFAFAILPILIFLPTPLNMGAFDLYWCESTTGYLFVYIYLLAILAIIYIAYICINNYRQTHNSQTLFTMLGAISFLLLLNLSDFVSDLVLKNYEINLIGPVGMLIFLVVLSYMIVRFKMFNIKLVAAQALVSGLIILIGSQLFFVSSATNIVLVTITFIIAAIGGYLLVKSVKREISQREEIERLAENLKQANERLKMLDKMKSEFVSIASHQLRSPLTSIRGYASMLLEGSYGKLPTKAVEAVGRIGDSSRFMALSVEDYLNVSRIEAGNMKYENADFNLKEVAEKVVDEMRPAALKKGLVLVFRSDCNGSCGVHADIGKTRQVILNLIDNAMKYTLKGTITVIAHDDVKKKKMYITIHDTGVGMSKDTLEDVFDKFVRAKNANKVNVTGTGLGLFVAKKMVEEMSGKIWAESEGEGKGSIFHVELPLLPGKYKR